MALKSGPYFLGYIFPIPIGMRDLFEFVARLVQLRKGFWAPFHRPGLAAARTFRDQVFGHGFEQAVHSHLSFPVNRPRSGDYRRLHLRMETLG